MKSVFTKRNHIKIIFLGVLVSGISALHYLTHIDRFHYHALYGELYFFPIALAGFWFGLRGALTTSLSITAIYLPFILIHWGNFSEYDLDRVIEILLYNTIAATLGVLKDRQVAESRRLLESESLAAMGKAISCVAHDMKTPLAAIGGLTRLVLKKLGEDYLDHEKLHIVVYEIQRLENMVKEMLDFSRPLKLSREHGDVNQTVRESLSVLTAEAQEKKVRIVTQLCLDLPLVAFDAMRMKAALINLITNAIQASPEGETVTLCSFQEKGNILIDVSDRGCGIPQDQKEEIFVPFFSTKKHGTGLGLAIVKKIVESHGGRLAVLDNQEKGTTIRIALPLKEMY